MPDLVGVVKCDNCHTSIPLVEGEWMLECPKCFTRVPVPRHLRSEEEPPPLTPGPRRDHFHELPVRERTRAPSRNAPRCDNHPSVPARWRCDRCRKALCPSCVQQRTVQRLALEICKCGGRCVPLSEAERGVARGTTEQLVAAFGYPLRGQSWPLLLTGAAFFFGGSIVATYSLAVGILLHLLLAAYLVAYVIRIIAETAIGREQPPEWPGADDLWESFVKPFLLVNLAGVLCAGPGLAFLFHAGVEAPVGWALLLAGGFCFPMALTAVAMFQTVSALNPMLVMRSIARIPFGYAVAACLFFAASLLKAAGDSVSEMIPYVGALIGCVASLYFLMVEARILGLLYRIHQTRLGWF
jgi:hypothetical protein